MRTEWDAVSLCRNLVQDSGSQLIYVLVQSCLIVLFLMAGRRFY